MLRWFKILDKTFVLQRFLQEHGEVQLSALGLGAYTLLDCHATFCNVLTFLGCLQQYQAW